jgi:hypothetical protein
MIEFILRNGKDANRAAKLYGFLRSCLSFGLAVLAFTRSTFSRGAFTISVRTFFRSSSGISLRGGSSLRFTL